MFYQVQATVAESTPSIATAAEALAGGDTTRLALVIGSAAIGIVFVVSFILLASALGKGAFAVAGATLGAGFVLLGSWVSGVSESYDEDQLHTAISENVRVHYNVSSVEVKDTTTRDADAAIAATVRMVPEGQESADEISMIYDPHVDMMVPEAIAALNNLPVKESPTAPK